MNVSSPFFKNLLFCIIFFCISRNVVQAQCVQIESILVAACGTPEGHNEMFRFRVGATAVNTSNLTINWPSNSWEGLVQNAGTAAKVATLNNAIVAAGGCAELLEPTAGVLPANAPVIVVTSYQFDTSANSFGALTEDTYILFQNSTATGGHFGNYAATGTRTLSMSFGGSCSESVTYTRNLLSQNPGATVNFTNSGTATYINNGCTAPVQPFTVDAGPSSLTVCPGDILNFTGIAEGYQTLQWNATQGSFSSTSTIATTYTVPASASGTIAVTLTATNSCGATISDAITLLVSTAVTPTFNLDNDLCNGETAPLLPTTSDNGITGTWLPAIVSSTSSGSYVFTPDINQCAISYTLNVTVATGTITPTFASIAAICAGETLNPLPTTSQNGITGVWTPALDNTTTTTYTFTPDAGQCATTTTLIITVNPSVIPTFQNIPAICTGETLNPLPTISQNGVTGTWTPALNNNATTTYTFTPNAGQCATTATLIITVNPSVIPTFQNIQAICTGETLNPLPTISQNGITGIWTPTLDNTTTTSYTFTPDAGQCATTTTLIITVNPSVIPTFQNIPAICTGETLNPLPTTSQNGITGTWTPVLDNTTTTTYTFTPDAGQCATSTSLTIIVSNTPVTPTFSTVNPICSGTALAPLPTTSQNGITGTWTPALNNNVTTTYTFTPDPNQCAINTTLTINVIPTLTPTFASVSGICTGESLSPLPTTSQNGITGTWTPTLDNTATTTYTFTPDTGQCATLTHLTITVNAIVTPTFTSINPICEGDNLNPLPTVSQNGINGAWTPALNNTTTTTYTFTPDAGQCANTQTLTIVVNNAGTMTPILGNDSVCIGDTLSLSNDTPGGDWSSSDTNVAIVDSEGLISPQAPGYATITYSTSNCASTSLAITVYLPPNPLLTDRFICVDKLTGEYISTVNMQCGVSNANHTFEWTLNGQPLPTTTNLHVATEEGLYQVTVTNIITGCTSSSTANVIKSSIAIAEAIVEQDFQKNQIITVTVTGGSGDYEYQLDNNWPQDSNQFVVQQGEYEITVIDKNGCGEETLTVFALNYPRYFTPNNDGYNDTWWIEGLHNQQAAQIFIFDRYGKLIKAIKPYLNESWDGTLNGHPLPATDYWFTLNYITKQGLPREFKSHFSLKR